MIRYNNNDTEVTPDMAIQLLKDGNQRFVNSLSVNRNLLQQVNDTRHGQKPFAAILSCMDSRAPAELLFDQGIGDIFSIRLAGNVVSENVIGSLEYAVAVAGSKLIMVMGHTNCGAVKGACDGVELGNLTGLLNKIRPSVDKEATVQDNRNGSNLEFVNKVALHNVHHSIESIIEQSLIIRELLEAGNIKIVPAMYDVASGEVAVIEESVPRAMAS